jgi:hypothetical protein
MHMSSSLLHLLGRAFPLVLVQEDLADAPKKRNSLIFYLYLIKSH